MSKSAAGSSLKELKEAFVTGHSGTTPFEILIVCISSPIGLFLFRELNFIVQSFLNLNQKNHYVVKLYLLVSEALVILLPMVICQTHFLYPYGVCMLVTESFLACYLHFRRRKLYHSHLKDNHTTSSDTSFNDDNNKIQTPTKLEFLTFYRSTVSYLTFIAILAVDFTIFPRSFAKTENYGYGLMDLGAGSFCVSGGLVSSYARGKYTKQSNLRASIILSMKHCTPLVIMGFIRLLTTKGLDYQEHVSEYGVHWNFFFTLSIVTLVSTLFRSFTSIMGMISYMVILIVYQSFLTYGGLQNYIESAPRTCNLDDTSIGSMMYICDMFAANREGILGCIGYLILYLVGEDVGRYGLWITSPKQKSTIQLQLYRLFQMTTLFWILLFILTLAGIDVSRRSTNASFIIWTVAHNLTILVLTFGIFYVTGQYTTMSEGNPNPPVFEAVNRNGLIVFILANLMTGAVNLSMNTLEVSHKKAIIVIFLYLCAVGAAALLIDSLKKKFKRKVVKTV